MLEQDVLGGEAERTAKARRRQDDTLRRVANGDNPVFAELAREVRAGRMLLMEAATSDAYRDHLAKAADRMVENLEAAEAGPELRPRH